MHSSSRPLSASRAVGTMTADWYKRRLLLVLLFILAFNYVDRLALGVSLQSIKTSLNLNDTQLGLLSGIAFALFYSTMGLPIARWADRGNRVTVIVVTTTLWSVAVSLCAGARTFAQLISIRIAVAIGEAGCIPPAHSLIADNFARPQRARAVSIYMLGAPLSAIIGYCVAGWLNQFYGWRAMFVCLGLPGIGLAWLSARTLREPRLAVPLTDDDAHASMPLGSRVGNSAAQPLAEVIRALTKNRTFRHLLFSFSIASFFGYGITQWQPSFFIRSYGISTGELGTWFAVIYGVGGLIGSYIGGDLASRWAADNEPRQLRAMSVMYGLFALVSASIYLSHSFHFALVMLGISGIGGSMVLGPLFATIQSVAHPRMRAIAISIIYLFANLIGMGLGPLAAGSLSDLLRPAFGQESLRYALLALCPGYLWGGWHLWLASGAVRHDIEATHRHVARETQN